MRLLPRALAVTAAALTLSALAVAPASATPEDGKGCAGIKEIPLAFVCVISATPMNAVPSTTTSSIPVALPTICYVADCIPASTVHVPVPGAQPGTGAVAVLWYQGAYYPIAVGTLPSLTLVQPYVDLVEDYTVAGVNAALAIVNDPPTIDEIGVLLLGQQDWENFATLVNDPPTIDEVGVLLLGEQGWQSFVTFVYETYWCARGWEYYC